MSKLSGSDKLSVVEKQLMSMTDDDWVDFYEREFSHIVRENWMSDKDLKKFFEDEKKQCELLDAKALEKELRGDV